ncbi:hypothetical protein [Dyadobacter sp. NIV53]|uniref:hypothetical protein n=1 Tax=Dyadobacter sp. NIV53 TaxID=2861765 RepID=UPI001C86A688|nr:hypothetical protein [Dyadobacter sp. NIV53]
MKYQFFLSIFSIILIVFACKESEIQIDENDLLSGKCKVTSFINNNRAYSLTYDSNGLLTNRFIILAGFEPIPYQKFDYKDGKLATIHKIDLDGRSFQETKFEYGIKGVNVIRKFERTRNYTDTTLSTYEAWRIEFKYGSNTNKPTSLTRWFKEENGDFSRSHTSEFEYNSLGNIIIEKPHVFPKGMVSDTDYTYEYFYDAQVNTYKQLYYLFFITIEDTPNIFSNNNKVRRIVTYGTQVLTDIKFNLQYDTAGNVTDDAYRFSAITWMCK